MERPTASLNPVCRDGTASFLSRLDTETRGILERRFGPGELDQAWRRDGRSYSCAYCGSMAVAELRRHLDAVPEPNFSLNDRRDKVYIDIYPHAGACSLYCQCGRAQDEHAGEPGCDPVYLRTSWGRLPITDHGFVHDPRRGGCACDVKRGGGPGKFYLRHLWDADATEAETNALYSRLMATCVRSEAAFMTRMRQRTASEVS